MERRQIKRKFIIAPVFDVRPVTKEGLLDIEKIKQVKPVLNLKEGCFNQEEAIRAKAIKIEAAKPEDLFEQKYQAEQMPVAKRGKNIKEEKIKKKEPEKELLKKEPGKDFSPVELDAEDVLSKEKIKKEPLIELSFDEPPSEEEIMAELEKIYREDSFLEQRRVEPVVEEEAASDFTDPLPEKEPEIISEGEESISSHEESISSHIEISSEVISSLEKEKDVGETEESEGGLSQGGSRPVQDDPQSVQEEQERERGKEEKNNQLDKNISYNQSYFPDELYQKYYQPSPIESSFVSAPLEKRSFKRLFGFLIIGFLVSLIVPITSWVVEGIRIKDNALSSGASAYQNLVIAKESLMDMDLAKAQESFGLAELNFIEASREFENMGRLALGILEEMPGGSAISSGKHLIKVGENLARAGQGLTSTAGLFSVNSFFNLINLGPTENKNILTSHSGSLASLMSLSQEELSGALDSIRIANQELSYVKADDLPDSIKPAVVSLKEKLPLAQDLLEKASDYSSAFLNVLGHNGSRDYLLIFQNNNEMRATGGFLGTYGLLTLENGSIGKLFVEDVFFTDGQLHEKIIPPKPIQEISTSWSMHNANWFADFPTSARKISWFYQKSGGQDVDGVISFTPYVFERLLGLTGPINMPEYNVVLGANNFIELVQREVEEDYDKTLNQPKKILIDFAPLFIDALNNLSQEKRQKAVEIVLNSFLEKHTLVYFDDSSLEELVKKEGWAGQLLDADNNYLSVVSSNIGGGKSDQAIKESIDHRTEIQEDGTIINTLVVVRKHQGGKYSWINSLNKNYLRVYLPLGSQLISASGQTKVGYKAPIDYQNHGFSEDSLINSIESNMTIDKESGTEIYQENGKTVFANWLYTKPGQISTLTYKYKLPFKIDSNKPADSYSLLVQKQSGTLDSAFNWQIKFPDSWGISLRYPENGNVTDTLWEGTNDLRVDRFLGLTFKF